MLPRRPKIILFHFLYLLAVSGLTMFKDVPNFKVICCGGDGTVGWILEAMGKAAIAFNYSLVLIK